MNKTLTFASGLKIECDGVVTGQKYNNYLHIHTGAVGFVEAAMLFGDVKQTETMTYEEKEEVSVYDGFTELIGIETDPMIDKPGALLIRLRRPEAEEVSNGN